MLALQQEPTLRALDDESVLALAAEKERIVVTRNSRDFAPILIEWARGGRSHSGCILVWSYDHAEHNLIVAGVEGLLARHPGVSEWRGVSRAI